jgi:hypothetical protein
VTWRPSMLTETVGAEVGAGGCCTAVMTFPDR